VLPCSHVLSAGSNTLSQYSLDKSIWTFLGGVKSDWIEMARFTHHLARNVEFFADALDVIPVLLPFAADIGARFVTRIPISHEYGGHVIILEWSWARAPRYF